MDASKTPPTTTAAPLAQAALNAAKALQKATPIEGVRAGSVSVSRGADSYTVVLTLPIEYSDTPNGEVISLVEYAK